MRLSVLFCVALAFCLVQGDHYGVDISSYIDHFSCLKSDGYDFAIPRCYQSNGRTDSNCLSNIKNANTAGMKADVYMFPCVPCGNATGQMDDLITYLKGAKYGKIWIDVEVYQWTSSETSNRNFITDLIQAGKAKKQAMGIYSSYYYWQSIVGLDWCYPEQQGLPLWYAHYDNNPSFSDYVSFGCWNKPLIKQYQGDAYECSSSIDRNWSPNYY